MNKNRNLGDTSLDSAIQPIPAEPGQDWRDSALCAQTGTEAFFPEKGEPASNAKKICQRCEVEQQCLEHALETNQRFGIWGGLSTGQRDRLKKQREDEFKPKHQLRQERRLERIALIQRMVRMEVPVATIASTLGVGERAAYQLIKHATKHQGFVAQ